METLVRAVGVLCCLLIGMGVLSSVAQLFAPKDEREAQGELRGLKMPALAMESVEDAGEVETLRDGGAKVLLVTSVCGAKVLLVTTV